ncbi:MAG: glycerate kinase [Treponema sp.]|nr:glycerate kinase [Treponema sp.]
MKIIIAPDSFKGNISASEICSIIETGIKKTANNTEIIKIPMADGGEGTAKAITQAVEGQFIKTIVTDPMGEKIEAEFGLINNKKTAVLDIASASGIELIPQNKLNPMKASSYGTGELISAALDTGAEEIIIGIGGSAVNDGGIGMLSALGYKFYDENDQLAGQGGEALSRIANIDCSLTDKRLKDTSIKAACDVVNPLLGLNGASAVFGPQKGATDEMIKLLDSGLEKLANAWIKAGLAEDANQPGDGAAGGIGAALRICLGAHMESGAMLVMKYTGFFNHLSGCDLIITGEGMTDGQTAGGKLCSVIARESRKAGIPVALISGALGNNTSNLLSIYDYAVSIACGQTGMDAMIKDSRRDLCFAAENLIRAIKIGTKIDRIPL